MEWCGRDAAQRSADAISVLRHDQMAALKLDKVGAAIAIDIGDDGVSPWTPRSGHHGGIHPRNKSEVGRRMGLRYAQITELVTGIIADGPIPITISSSAGQAFVEYHATTAAGMILSPTEDCVHHGKVPKGLSCCQSTPNWRATRNPHRPNKYGFPFELGLSNGTHVLATATVTHTAASSGVKLTPTFGKLGAGVTIESVRYAWQPFPLCVLRNSAGLPSAPFNRTVNL